MTTPSPRLGVLLLHGFTGNPDTMRPLQAPLGPRSGGIPAAAAGPRGIFAASVDRRHLG